jgi:hypothetical protein
MSTIPSKLEEEDPAVFDARFGRCSQMLHMIARRILFDPELRHAGNLESLPQYNRQHVVMARVSPAFAAVWR